MNSYVKLSSVVGLIIGVTLLFTIPGFFLSAGEPQTTFAKTSEDQYVYLPIINKPVGPEYKIVFSSDRNRNPRVNDIYVMNMEGENIQQLTDTPDISEDRPAWSPDGTMIAYTSGEEGQEEVFVMNADGSNKHNVSNSASSSDKRFVWAPDSSKLSFISDRIGGRYDLYVVNADGSGLTNLTQTTDADEWGIDWSPDGSKIVYLSDKTQSPYPLSGGNMIVMNANGSNKQVVFNDTGWNRPAVWTPDGSKLTFSVYNECIALMNPDGTGLIPCFIESPRNVNISDFIWNSTGSQLVFETGEIGSYLYVYDSATEQSSQISSGSSTEDIFAWSADDTKIIGHGQVSGYYEIFIIDADGSNYQNLTDNIQIDDLYPDVSPVKVR